MTNETYEKLQAELSQLLNTEKYKRMTRKNKDVYKQAVLACKSVTSHYKVNVETEPVSHGQWVFSPDHAEGICTMCNFKIYGRPYNNTYLIVPYNYCPNCGAKMEE